MKRPLALALTGWLVSAPALAQQATRAQRGSVSGGLSPAAKAGHVIPPAGQVTDTAHAAAGVHSSTQLVHGASIVLPAKSAREQVQGSSSLTPNALNAAQGTLVSGASLANGPNLPANPIIPGGSGPTAQLPSPRQPLSDVVANPGVVRITIRAISAVQKGALDIDGRLAPIDRDLRSFAGQFSYRNYRLLDVQTFELDFRSIAQMELPGARAVAIEPRQLGTDGQVHVHLELLKQSSEHGASMKTDFSIPRGSTFLVGGYRIDPNAPDSGTLLLAITQEQ